MTQRSGQYQVEVSLQIGAKTRTEVVQFMVKEPALKQPEGWPSLLWYKCWNTSGEYLDFTTNAWEELGHGEQIQHARAYQQWYSKYKQLPVSKQVPAGKSSIEVMLIPPGKFWMGSPEYERDRGKYEYRHAVLLSKHYYIGKHEVTQQQWQAVMGYNPENSNRERDPAIQVNWNECAEFCRKLGGKLPTEAQWEYACRAGTTEPFNLGGDINTEWVNYNGNYPYYDGKGMYRGWAITVGSLANENSWGCFDFHGNAWEWCSDWYERTYPAEVENPIGPAKGLFRVLRGGSFSSHAKHLRSAFRFYNLPDENSHDVGMRFCAPENK